MWKARCSVSAILKLWLALFALLPTAFGGSYDGPSPAEQLVQNFPLVTNISELRHAISGSMGSLCAFNLEGIVLAADADSGMVFFQDDSGTEILEVNLAGQTLQPGQRVQLRGTNYVVSTKIGVSLGKNPVVDNDGRHPEAECTATINLKAGRYPIEVLWFNYTGNGSLSLEYSGPNLARKIVPDSALFRRANAAPDGATGFVNGLNYRGFEGDWQKLPPFSTLAPVKTGVAANFDLKVKSRDEHVGLAYDGFIQINNDGLYTFYLESDDGSELFINNTPTRLTVTGSGDAPAPRRIVIRQPLPGEQGAFWGEVEGAVTFLGQQQDGIELELTSEDTHMRVTVCDDPQEPPRYLLGSRVRVRGICLDTSKNREHRLADTLVVSNWKSVQVLDIAPEFWSANPSSKISDCQQMKEQATSDFVRVYGRLRSPAPGQLPNLEDATGSVPIELLNSIPALFDDEVECLGRWSQSGSNGVLREAVWRVLPKNSEDKTNALPLLTTAAQVQQLKREEAQRGYQAKVQGVVTWVSENRDCVVIQDSTRGVFVGLRKNWIWDSPKIGEILKVEGTCVAGEFSPILILNKGERLGMGLLPAPMHPTWDQLIGGSMDSQYIEIRGFVTGGQDNHLTLLMSGGKVDVEFDPKPNDALESFINSVVRIRGCIFAKWDHSTLQVTPHHPLWFGNATISVDTPPPLDPFDAHKMRARELMQFDVQGNIFRRVKISGQVLAGNAGMYYLTDEGFGLRFELSQPMHFEPGDNVETVGLVELGGASPVLREAIARKIGHSPLPAPQPLTLDSANITYDATRVWVEGVLVDAKGNGPERVLEMQTGLKSFVARLPVKSSPAGLWPIGSRLKLTGVFSDLEGGRMGGVKSFELLLNSPTDVEVMARPPWWTLNRLLTMIALLAAGLVLAFIWINLLRRQVERRTIQLKREIGERERAEQGRAIEQERSRIARDLHDDLGSSLTAISMLAMTSPRTKLNADASNERLQLIVDRSRSMVTALDALVWAVNPKNDTVAALAEYLASFAEELLAKTEIFCHVELPLDFPHQTIAAETRHNVLLSVKESLTNAIRHGRPSEVLLQLMFSGSEFKILIKDNGCGFDPAGKVSGDGLANLQERMRKINGSCQIVSSPGKGTTVSLTLPL